MKRTLLIVAGIAAFAGLSIFLQPPKTANAQGNTDTDVSKSQTTTTSPTDTYQYTAKAGDSYSVLARKAIQTYGIESKTNLSGAQIIYAETGLTQASGSPFLLQGQAVSISKNTIKTWVEKAQKLSKTQEAAWNLYVPYVNFNTNNNG